MSDSCSRRLYEKMAFAGLSSGLLVSSVLTPLSHHEDRWFHILPLRQSDVRSEKSRRLKCWKLELQRKYLCCDIFFEGWEFFNMCLCSAAVCADGEFAVKGKNVRNMLDLEVWMPSWAARNVKVGLLFSLQIRHEDVCHPFRHASRRGVIPIGVVLNVLFVFCFFFLIAW